MITQWTRKYDAGSVLTSNFKYDAADQLVEASVPSVSSVVKEFVYRYDKSGNRTSEQVDSTSLAHTINTLNQVTAIAAGGPIRFEGSLNEPGKVAIGGVPAEVAGDDSFKADVPLSPGTPLVTVAATDAASNPATQDYDVPVGSASSRSLTYDLNGNMLSNGAGQSYTWDSADRMTKITYTGGESTEFTYDGLGRRVKIVEKNSGGSLTSEKRFVWDGMTIAEERDGSNAPTKRFYGQGVMVGSDEFFVNPQANQSTVRTSVPSGEDFRVEQLLGYRTFTNRRNVRLRLTQHPSGLPASCHVRRSTGETPVASFINDVPGQN